MSLEEEEEEDGDNEEEMDWQCELCTFAGNKKSFLSCFMCSKPRGSGMNDASISSAGGSATRRQDLWHCKRCTFAENMDEALSCLVCATPRGVTTTGKKKKIDDEARTEAMFQEMLQEIGHDEELSTYVQQGDIFSLICNASGLATEDPNIQIKATWCLMKLAREDVNFRMLMISHGSFSCFCEIFSRTKTNSNYVLKALAALTLAYMLPSVNQDTMHYMKFEIKESLDFLCTQCKTPIVMENSQQQQQDVMISVQDIQSVGKTKGLYRGIQNNKDAAKLEKTTTIDTSLPAPPPPSSPTPPSPPPRMTRRQSVVANSWIARKHLDLIEQRDFESMFRWLASSSQPPVEGLPLLTFILESVHQNKKYRSEVIALDSQALDALVHVIAVPDSTKTNSDKQCLKTNSNDEEEKKNDQNLCVHALAAMIIAYLLCSPKTMLSLEIQCTKVEASLSFLEELAKHKRAIMVNNNTQLLPQQLRYTPAEARRYLHGHIHLLQATSSIRAMMEGKGHQERMYRKIQTLKENKGVAGLINMLQKDKGTTQSPILQLTLLVALEHFASTADDRLCKEIVQEGAIDCVLSIHGGAASNDTEIRTITGITIAHLVMSGHLSSACSDYVQQLAILDAAAFLCAVSEDIVIHLPSMSSTTAHESGALEANHVEYTVAVANREGQRMMSSFMRPDEAKPSSAYPKQTHEIDKIISDLNHLHINSALQLTLVSKLLEYAQTNQELRDRMIALDVFEPLLWLYRQSEDSHYSLRAAIALTIAHLIRSSYQNIHLAPRKLRTAEKCLENLQNITQGITLNGATVCVNTLTLLGKQAQNYLGLIQNQEMRETELIATQSEGVGLTSNGGLGVRGLKKPPSITRRLRPTSLYRKRSAGGAFNNIETTLICLASPDRNRRIDAVLSILRIVKDYPTQRRFMHNYDVVDRLMDLVHTEDPVGPQLQVLSALAVAYIAPSLKEWMLPVTKSSDLQDCMRLLAIHASQSIIHNSAEFSRHEIAWAAESLGRCIGTEPQIRQQENASTCERSIFPVKKNDLLDLLADKDVLQILELLRLDSCRQLDATLLLLAIVAKESEATRQVIVSNDGMSVLLKIFSSWEHSSDDLRIAAATIISLVVPNASDLAEEHQESTSHALQYLHSNDAVVKRVLARAAAKDVSARQFKFEPTSYNFIQDDGFVELLILNSLGIVGGAVSCYWSEIRSCNRDPVLPSSVQIFLRDLSKHYLLFNVIQPESAARLLQDIDQRLRLFESLSEATFDLGLSKLKIPPVQDISIADRPGMLWLLAPNDVEQR